MHRLMSLVLLLGACSKAHDEPPAASKPAGGASGARHEPAGGPDPARSPTRWLALDLFGIEVEAPDCAELTEIDKDSIGVGPKDPACPLAFPGAVFTRTLDSIAPTLEEQLANMRTDPTPPEILRQEKTETGWIIAWKHPASADGPARPGFNERYTFGGPPFACIAFGSYTDAQMAGLSAICTSARKKR